MLLSAVFGLTGFLVIVIGFLAKKKLPSELCYSVTGAWVFLSGMWLFGAIMYEPRALWLSGVATLVAAISFVIGLGKRKAKVE
jgi:hypothetical protein